MTVAFVMTRPGVYEVVVNAEQKKQEVLNDLWRRRLKAIR